MTDSTNEAAAVEAAALALRKIQRTDPRFENVSLMQMARAAIAAHAAALAGEVKRPVGLGIGVHALAGEIAAAVSDDEQNGGCDISAGMFGPKFSALIRTIAHEYLTHPTSAPDVAALREPIVIDAVATVQLDREEGPYLDWLIEGGIADLAVGTVLMVSATNLTNDEGYGEVYVAQQETAHAKA